VQHKKRFLRKYKYARDSFESLFRPKLRPEKISETDVSKQYEIIKRSNLFDSTYYLNNNPDVARSGIDPLLHFVKYGGAEGRNPSPQFNNNFYLAENSDVREMRMNPLIHYLQIGIKEGRKSSPEKLASTTREPRNKTKKVDIINVNFYDWNGKVLYKGGAERYVFDLAKQLVKCGYTPRIVQNANVEFSKRYKDIEVKGVVTGATDSTGPLLRKMSKAFSKECEDADLIIASPLDLACEITTAPVVGINHGIHWDSVLKRLYNNRTSDYKEIFDALENIILGVCVDTNFINWTRTYDYKLAEKLRYVPNYYDKNHFKKTTKNFDGNLTIMFPRRLYDARGIHITIDAFKVILKKHKNVNLLLVGQTDDNKIMKQVKDLMRQYPNKVRLEEYEMEDMPEAYKKSNVVIIPTRYAEGTSLSCLEAMATNNALIATNIGGLPNLVIDSFNGLLIPPTKDYLVEAVETLITDRRLAKKLAENGLEVVKAFEKSHWDDRWQKIFKEVL
jgi:glycosyltransferase involved in cell wall biosynthesis